MYSFVILGVENWGGGGVQANKQVKPHNAFNTKMAQKSLN